LAANCTQFDQLILRKIVKIVATRCHILRLKCTKFDFGWGSLQRSPDPLARFQGQGSPSKQREGKGRKGRESGNKSPEWLSQKLGSIANAAVNNKTALNLIS